MCCVINLNSCLVCTIFSHNQVSYEKYLSKKNYNSFEAKRKTLNDTISCFASLLAIVVVELVGGEDGRGWDKLK